MSAASGVALRSWAMPCICTFLTGRKARWRCRHCPEKCCSCVELGGETVTCTQSEDRLVLKLEGAKTTDLHSVVKLTLEPGDPIPVIAVESEVEQVRS